MLDKKIGLLIEIFGDYRQQGEEYLFSCPECNFHKKKLSFNINKDCFKCWYCDWRSNSIYWAISKYGTRRQKIIWRDLAGIIDHSEEENQNFLEENLTKSLPVDLPKEFRTLSTKKISVLSLPARKYLLNRGITEYDIAYWKIGFCPEGKYSDRIIIPSFNGNGDVNYFVARNYKNQFVPYKNPPAPHNFIFNELYLDWEKDVVLCEGVFDAIVAGNAIPLLGSTLREDSYILRQLVFNNATVYLALDPDAEFKEEKIKHLLLKYGLSVYKISVKPYKDVGEMTKIEFQKRKNQAEEITNDSIFEKMLVNL